MLPILRIGFALSLLFCCFAHALEVSGISIPKTLSKETTTLNLNGAGVRDKFFIDLYVAALYTSGSFPDVPTLVKADESMCLSLHIISSLITSQKMEEATREGLAHATNMDTKAIHDEIEAFIRVFQEPIALNDVYELFYTPTQGVAIYKNGKLISTIQGLAFKQALFGIWLGETPAQESLKKELVGRH